MFRGRSSTTALVLLVAALASLRGGAPARATGPGVSAANPCGTVQPTPLVWQHVVWILMENKSFDDVIGSGNAPYVNALARRCGVATNVHFVGRPSLPNYIALTSGSTQGIADDGSPAEHPLAVPSIFSQLGAHWRMLVESMPSACSLSDSGLYAVRHNPASYYPAIRRTCLRRDVPLRGAPDISAEFTIVIPNLCHDMHACPSTNDDIAAQTRAGDQWLSRYLPRLLATREYASGSTAVFVTWDESDADASDDTPVPFLVVAPTTRPGTRARAAFDDYSVLRTTEDMLGLPEHLGRAAGARSMRRAFRL